MTFRKSEVICPSGQLVAHAPAITSSGRPDEVNFYARVRQKTWLKSKNPASDAVRLERGEEWRT